MLFGSAAVLAGMLTRIRLFFHPGSEFNYFNPKDCFESSRKNNPGYSSRIRIFLPIPDPDPQHCFLASWLRDLGRKKVRIRIRDPECGINIPDILRIHGTESHWQVITLRSMGETPTTRQCSTVILCTNTFYCQYTQHSLNNHALLLRFNSRETSSKI